MPDTLNGRPIVFGEVLFDRFPDGSSVLGGAPFNVAWNLQAFGLSPLLISRVGDDEHGQRIRSAMHQWDMDTSGLQLDRRHPTGLVQITIADNEPSFEIVADSAWDFIDAATMPGIDAASLLYHGSLATRQPVSAAALDALRDSATVPAFIDVNLRDPWWQTEQVLEQLRAARWAKLNEDELARLAPQGTDISQRAISMLASSDLEMLIVTRGKAGATCFRRDADAIDITPGKSLSVVDTVGAGDAFASVIIAGLLQQWPLETTLQRAQDFASAVVGMRGATTIDPGFYSSFVSAWRTA